MAHRGWVSENRKIIICVDSYSSDGIKGRFYKLHHEMGSFCGFPELLIRIDKLLEEQREPQSYTQPRTFASLRHNACRADSFEGIRRGNQATFELQVLFRQHSSWQGTLRWREKDAEQSFRSVLELIYLMDSALHDAKADPL